MWIISKKAVGSLVNNCNTFKFENYFFYTDNFSDEVKPKELKWFYTGYISPRDKVKSKYKNFSTYKLLDGLYSEFNEDFINYIKGNFILIQLKSNSFTIYSDRFGIQKFFYWKDDGDFLISDNIKEILTNKDCKPSRENIAIYTLTYHFTGGRTLFHIVFHNQPAERLHYDGNKLENDYYWNPADLLTLTKRDKKILDISNALSDAVESNLQIIDNNRISLSLTGGADTRNLLGIFLSKTIKPHLYTYGNPNSADCKKATSIANGLNLKHEVHDIQMDAITFERYARHIIRQSGGLSSIHRVHRIIAVEREKPYAESMFLGTLGGEYVKGVSEDDYIVPPVVYDNWKTEHYKVDMLKSYFNRKRLNFDPQFVQKIVDFLSHEPYMKGEIIKRKLNSLNYITAHLHDAQDVNLYNTVMDYVFTPFLDIDYLETLFSSQFTFDQKEIVKNKMLRRFENPIYASRFLETTYKPLTKFRYSGEHIPAEVLTNKYYAGFMKLIRQKTKPKYPPNFPLDDWMKEFVLKKLPICKEYKILEETFDLDEMLNELKSEKYNPKESYWLKYTNPIMMMFIIDEFKS
ncbi:MAG: hypothetical protein ACOCP4_02150 [Candidatus Woesearchaeota archaeon]